MILTVLLSSLAVPNLAKAQNASPTNENCGSNSITSESTFSSYSPNYMNCNSNSLAIPKIAGRNALQTLSCNDALSDLYLYRSEANTALNDLSCDNNPELSKTTSPQCCKKHGGTNHKPKSHKPKGGSKWPDPFIDGTIPEPDVPL